MATNFNKSSTKTVKLMTKINMHENIDITILNEYNEAAIKIK